MTYAVIDTETTGLLPGFRHRIAEIAVIHVDADGTVTDEWCTLLNPERDLGPQAIHGIRAADARRAPRFADMAGDIVERLRDRIPVAHNWPFDAMHLRAEFERVGIEAPLEPLGGLCTMRAASKALPGSGRSLIDCCASAGLPEMNWHTARDDAMAAAALLRHILTTRPEAVRTTEQHRRTVGWPWPALTTGVVAPFRRTPIGQVEPHFLARLVERMPRDEEPMVDAYFAMLDAALLDRRISASEADALIALADDLGLHRSEALAVHHGYLRELARAAWADGVLTEDERRDVQTVATLLGLDAAEAERVLAQEKTGDSKVTVGGLVLRPGDRIVLTGTMRRAREEIVERAVAAGLRVTGSVSGKTRVVAAADPDSLSGKAKQARELGVAVVSEEAFLRALDAI
ncbi:exonuclease domain-containing protein [Kutzneria sp. 744]|uniref:exonuclease domain-containing protein n=1 Tax=Kutzneria sp. (strain 744) TaxID=345341 RepID=UPI0004B91C06|nr:exonuclease domain-containing protein [Kutzneria sp. 744]